MLTKPSTSALRALHKLSQQPEWREVGKMFEEELAEAFKHLMSSRDNATLYQMQGRAQQIRDLMDLTRDASKILEKLRESTL